jgi:hypothetical protein
MPIFPVESAFTTGGKPPAIFDFRFVIFDLQIGNRLSAIVNPARA